MIHADAPCAPSIAERGQSAQELGPASAPPSRSLPAVVRRGALWSAVGYGGSQALRFAGNLLLTRLLVPEAFGLMAIANAVLLGLQLVSDIGIGPSIIQGRRGDDPVYLDTAWTVQVLRGAALSLVAAAIAWPVAAFYGDPPLAWVLLVCGSTALISGFNSTRLFSLYRKVDLARVSAVELGSQAAGLAVMLAWAAVDASIWALVAGGVASSLARLIASHTALPGTPNRFRWERSALAHILGFGRWIFLSTALTFLVGQSDRLIFGKLVPLALLGVYSVGAMIATMPSVALSRMAASVFFPVYSRVQNAGEELGPVFTRVRQPLLVLAGWMIAGLAGGGAAAVRLLYDQRYDEAGWIVELLALASWFSILESTNGAALLARGEARWVAASNGGKLLGMVALIPAGYALGGFPGAVAGLAASEVLKYAVSAFAVARAGLRGWRQDLQLTGWVLASAALAWLVAGAAEQRGWSHLATAALVLAVVTLAWAPLGLPFVWRKPAGHLRSEAR